MKKYRARFENKDGPMWLTNNRQISVSVKNAAIGSLGDITITILDMIKNEPRTVHDGEWKFECLDWHDVEIGNRVK